MTDIDFEALDKAVNNLMSGVDATKRAPVLDDPAENVVSLDISSDAPSLSALPVAAPAPVPATTPPDTQPSALPSPATKRRGQFMDIMAPTKPASAPVSRRGVTLQPSAESESLSSLVDDAPAPTATPEMTISALEVESTGSAVSDAGMATDPVVEIPPVASQEAVIPETENVLPPAEPDLEVKEEVAASGAKSDDLPDSILDEVAAQSMEEPLVSPFLPDAKVDKRPLGSPVTMPDPIDITTEPVDIPEGASPDSGEVAVKELDVPAEVSTDSAAQNEEKPVDAALPHEAANIELSRIESESPVAGNESSSAVQVDTTKEELLVTSAAPTEPVQPPAGGSIAQQYAEQPSTGDATSGAIFDTATYHTGVDTPVDKQKPSVLKWILWALVFVALGGAGGAVYFFLLR